MMQPDEVTLGKMMEDSTIMDGFNDPEVMSAVAEIAQNPEAYPKHAAKVSKFYKGMGDILAPKLQQAAAKVTTRA
ncbi:g12765 [Coccomyxa viridis]|uniref:G12765 protein n=1 Tax=Coccomyxa viridis TaxID=1274662 RepID=A0ABP1GDT3_9CHLO